MDERENGGAVWTKVSTSVLTICAVLITWNYLRGTGPEPPISENMTPQSDWLQYAESGHRIGPPDAAVTVVEFADFQCPACRYFAGIVKEAQQQHPGALAIVYRHFPLTQHAHARGAAIASECAAAQGRFAEMHDALYASADSIGVAQWEQFARRAEVPDLSAFSLCLRDSIPERAVDRDMADAKRLALRSTPTLLVNGHRIRGAIGPHVLDSIIRAAVGAGTQARE